jgi:cytochrome P450
VARAVRTILDAHGRISTELPPLLTRRTPRRIGTAMDSVQTTVARLIADGRSHGLQDTALLSGVTIQADPAAAENAWTEREVTDYVRTLLLAGYVTLATGLAWTWYLLSQHPEVEANLHAELDAVLGGRPPTAGDAKRLPYTERVFAEALRLYPPVWVLRRWAVRDCDLGGYAVPAGSMILMSPWVMHHDERYFPEPFRFDPERWTPEAQANRPAFTYFPFGGGLHQCLGEGFAWMEGILVIATLAQTWRMRPVPGQRVEPWPSLASILRLRHDLRMVVQRRR